MQKPAWWPRNPYSESVFPMPREQYPNIVPNPELRTALSGMLGREFWEIASETIWEAMIAAIEDDCLYEEWLCPDCSNKLLRAMG